MKAGGWGLLVAAALAAAIFIALPSAAAAAQQRDYDCSDFESQAEAEEYLEPGDPYGLDADDDGIACESNPCPCSSGSGGGGGGGSPSTPAPAPKPPKLSTGAAKRTAKAKARRYVSRSARVSSLSFAGCSRRSRGKVICKFLATGERKVRRTSCRLRVRVTGEGNSASAKLRASCRSRSTLFLTAERASVAISEAGAELRRPQ